MEEQPDRLEIGQIWYDKYRKWTKGATDLNFVHVILSADKDYEYGTDNYYWLTAAYMWVTDGYCGAHTQKFLEEELRMMVCVGSIKDIIKFDK